MTVGMGMTNAHERPCDESFEALTLESVRDLVERAIRIGNGADPRARRYSLEAAQELGRAYGFSVIEAPQ